MRVISWKEVKVSGGKHSKILDPLMLSSDGVSHLREIRLVGESEREWIKVIYDRDYVLEKFVIEYINRLNLPLEQLIELVEDAWEYKNQMNGRKEI